jgi:predicted HTH domain antitoxin
MTKVELELPEEAFSALRVTPEEFIREMRFAAATHWYQQAVISGSKAAQIAGMTRLAFLDELSRRKLSILNLDAEDLKHELERG